MSGEWNFNRRDFLKVGGALAAGLAFRPTIAFSAEGDLLKIRTNGDLQVLDPAFMIGNIEEMIMRCVYVSLNRLGDIRQGAPWVPYGAETLEQVDAKTIKFTLIPGLKWTGGFGAVTPEDVKFSYERIANPDNQSPWAYQFEKLDKVEVVDDRSGIIHLKEPYQPIFVTSIPYYGGHIVSKAATEKVGGKFTTEPPAFCGPYVIEAWEQKQKVVLASNPDWPAARPDFGRIEIYIVEDDQAAQLAYEAGSFDYTRIAVSAAKTTKEKMPPDSKLIEAQSTRYIWLTINIGNPKLGDPRIRQAIQSAIDVDQVLAGAYDNLVGRSTGVVQPGTPYARKENLIAKPDYDKAKALLAEAGVPDLAVNLVVVNDSTSLATGQIIQASLAQAGITAELQPTDDAAYWALGDKTQGDTYKTLDLVLMGFAGGVDPSENLVWFRPDQIGVYNWSGFDSAEYEELYQKILSETDEAKRIEMTNRMENLMEESGGFVFICHEPFVALHRAGIEPVILPDGHINPAAVKKTA
jgi:peptide/nickel transport system substrate-binding protein